PLFPTHRSLPPFPTRRSSDLIDPDARVKAAMNEINAAQRMRKAAEERGEAERILRVKQAQGEAESNVLRGKGIAGQRKAIVDGRSEEHTSELQSRENLVCRLL